MLVPMRLVLALVVFSGCTLLDPTREAEENERSRLDARYAGVVELRDNLVAREQEHAQILTALEPFRTWPDDATLAASVHPDAGVSSKQLGFYRVVTISSPGDAASAFLAAESLDTRGAGRVTVVRPGPPSFSVDVAVVQLPKAGATAASAPVFDESAVCFKACQQRRAFIVEQARRIDEVEAQLGLVKSLPRDKRALLDMLQTQGKLGEPHHAFFHVLATAPWASEVQEAWTSGPDVLLRMKPTFDPSTCETVLRSVASCAWDEKKRVVVLAPVK